MIQARNIDFTTFKNNFPIAQKQSVQVGYNIVATFRRIANIVTVDYNGFPSVNTGSGWIQLGETIPYGYRPINAIYATVQMQAGDDGQHEFKSDGSMRLFCRTSSTTWRALACAWVTNEPFPTGDIS